MKSSCGLVTQREWECTTLSDAILDRIIHDAYRLRLSGEGLRKKKLIKIG
jgi:hypothetical protein